MELDLADDFAQSRVRKKAVDVDLEKFFDRVNRDILIVTGAVVKFRVADPPMASFKQRTRQLTRRSGECSMGEVVQLLRPYFGSCAQWWGPAA